MDAYSTVRNNKISIYAFDLMANVFKSLSSMCQLWKQSTHVLAHSIYNQFVQTTEEPTPIRVNSIVPKNSMEICSKYQEVHAMLISNRSHSRNRSHSHSHNPNRPNRLRHNRSLLHRQCLKSHHFSHLRDSHRHSHHQHRNCHNYLHRSRYSHK